MFLTVFHLVYLCFSNDFFLNNFQDLSPFIWHFLFFYSYLYNFKNSDFLCFIQVYISLNTQWFSLCYLIYFEILSLQFSFTL